MRSFPPKSLASFMATDMDSGYRLFPDIYISSLGSSPAFTSTGKVLVIFTPNSRPFSPARACKRSSMGTASLYCKSSLKWKSPKAT